MKTIFRLAKTELRILFCSPVSWLILVIFAFQAGLSFSDNFGGQLKRQALEYGLGDITLETFAGYVGLMTSMVRNLYLYIPLITMGLMSRELSSGSIKFLYSSPITTRQIILGKYLSMMIYGAMLMAILLIYIIFGAFTIENMDLPLALTGLLGLYLLTCAYAAIGLFMSSITSYQVVAAMGTLAILAVLNFIGDVGQGIAFVRDITYWLSMSGRAYKFLAGMICSEDMLYFIIVISLFILLSIMRLQSGRKKRSLPVTLARYCIVIGGALFIGYLSSLPISKVYYDATQLKTNTLTPGSQEVVKKLDGGLTITTYMNILDKNYGSALPSQLKSDFERFEQYVRFKPEIKMEYVYYYAPSVEPSFSGYFEELQGKKRAEHISKIMKLDFDMFLSPEEIDKIIDLKSEGYRFVRVLERENGQKTTLRLFDDMMKHPTETEITTALKRFLVPAPKVAFLTGHGERNVNSAGERFYYTFARSIYFRQSLINQGFDATELTIKDQDIPEDINILVIADMRTPLSPEEMQRLEHYIERGGNLFILGEPNRQEAMNPILAKFGVKLLPGTLVQQSEDYLPSLITAKLTDHAATQCFQFKQLQSWDASVVMPDAAPLQYTPNQGYDVKPLAMTLNKNSWNELETTDFLDGELSINEKIGEKEQSYPVILSLTRMKGEKEQRIIITGDADCISNGELANRRNGIYAANFSFITETFRWLSYGEFPIDTSRPKSIDKTIFLTRKATPWIKLFALGVIPFFLAFAGFLVWYKRKGR
ncbi:MULTISPECIES: Gldg family protein [Butyricimonas]|jgi:ABC-2 type transport system permease protein|uniref:Gldg family protein n=1 Tax=Butyricimonas TaxID=574697 RepID=UPI0022E84711|nr:MULTISPECIES: Gldg family protein [Butyricimonas]